MNSTKEVEIVGSIPQEEDQKDPETGSNSIDSRPKLIPQEQERERERERELEHGSSLSEKVEVVVERNLILAASIGDDFQLEVTADQINSHCATADTQTVDIEEPLDEETKQLRTSK